MEKESHLSNIFILILFLIDYKLYDQLCSHINDLIHFRNKYNCFDKELSHHDLLCFGAFMNCTYIRISFLSYYILDGRGHQILESKYNKWKEVI